MISEYDFYMNLYDEFIETRDQENEKILWKTNSIIKLMKFTEGNEEGEFCENALRMIMVLFKHFSFSPYELSSYNFDNKSNQDKDIITPILKQEFNIF
jgi:hypothetical protein